MEILLDLVADSFKDASFFGYRSGAPLKQPDSAGYSALPPAAASKLECCCSQCFNLQIFI